MDEEEERGRENKDGEKGIMDGKGKKETNMRKKCSVVLTQSFNN